jgi:tRNA(Ile)-lysidine synthase
LPHHRRLSPAPLNADFPAARLPDWVLDFVHREKMFHPGDRVLVAVSGGPDSVALLHLLAGWRRELGLELGVGHFDHGMRRESQEDAAFVADLARSLGLSLYPGRGDVKELARRKKLSRQMAARQLRLDFLRQTCQAQGYDKLALAHTADDQVELFFLRLLRGAGPEGLKGMWPATPDGLVRPLLAVGKATLLAWLEEQGLSYRRDPSNLSRAYRRNRIRLDLLPELQRLYNPRLPEAVWRAQALLQAEERLLAGETDRLLALVCRSPAPDFYRLDLARLLALDPGWQARLLRAALGRLDAEQTLTAAQTAAVLDLAQGEKSGGLISLGAARVARAGPELHLFRRLPVPPAGGATLPAVFPGAGETPPGWHWTLNSRPRAAGGVIPLGPQVAVLDQERLNFPLEVRYFKPGDRFWPLGGPGPRKLQDFLVDAKIPRWLRPYIPLVVSAGRIVWVAGLRPAEPVKVTGASRSLLTLEISPQTPDTRRIWEMLLACRENRDTSHFFRQDLI